MGTGSFPGVKRAERGIDHPPHLAPSLKNDYRYTSIALWAFMACYRVTFIFSLPAIGAAGVPGFTMIRYGELTGK